MSPATSNRSEREVDRFAHHFLPRSLRAYNFLLPTSPVLRKIACRNVSADVGCCRDTTLRSNIAYVLHDHQVQWEASVIMYGLYTCTSEQQADSSHASRPGSPCLVSLRVTGHSCWP